MLENRQLLNVWLEPLLEQSANLVVNDSGKLLVDTNGNYLNDNISGGKQVYRVDGFNGDGILFYTSKTWSLVTGDFNIGNKTNIQNYYNALIIPDNEIVNYKIGAVLETINSFDGNSVTLASPYTSTSHTIFKVILNGKVVTDWYSSTNIISFNSGYRPFGNNLVVVYYKNNQTHNGETCNLYFKSAIKSIPSYLDFQGIQLTGTVANHSTNKFMIVGTSTNFKTELKKNYMVKIDNNKYKVLQVLGDTFAILDKVLPTFSGEAIYLNPAYNLLSVDSDISLNPSSTFYSKNIVGSKLGTKKYLSTNNTTQLSKWVDGDSEAYEIYPYPVMHDRVNNYINTATRFRVIFINKANTEMIILTNARLTDKVNMNINTDKTVENLNIEYEDKITILNYNEIFGNDNIYGEGYFGGLKILKDSEAR